MKLFPYQLSQIHLVLLIAGFLTLTGNTVSSLITNDGDGTGTVEENLRFISNTQLQVTGSVSIS